jgi:porin
VADRKASPIEQFYSFGLGGQGLLDGRDRDRFVIGYYYFRRRSDLPGILLNSYEQAMEMFYNVAATNWLYVTPDVQVIIDPGRRGSETAFITGLRVQTRF